MIRRVLFLLAALSQVLLILTLFFWARSYWVLDWVDGPQRPETWEVLSDRGAVYFHYQFFLMAIPNRPAIEVHAEPNHGDEKTWAENRYAAANDSGDMTRTSFAGFQYLHFATDRDLSSVYAVPYWFIALLLAILPLWRWLATRRDWRAMKRALARVCSKCGYDPRTATQKCPECGGPVGRV